MSKFKVRPIKMSEHVSVAGRTGSGKTYLTEKYMAGFPHVVCLDTKGTTKMPSVPAKEVATITRLADLPYVDTPRIIYRPDWEELKPEFFDEFFRWCYRRGNTVVWVDEVMSVCPNASVIPEWYKAILTRGRELNVAMWSCTQRPMGIPNVILSESSHFFVYDLNMESDRDKLASMTGAKEMEEKPSRASEDGTYHKYAFWYYHVDMEHAKLCQLGKEVKPL